MNARRTRIERSDRIGVRLSQGQRKLIVDETYADDHLLRQFRLVSVDGELPPVKFTLDDWEDLQGHVAAASNHHENKKTSRELLAIFERIQEEVFDRYNDQN